MQEELRRYNNIGDIAGIEYFTKQVLGNSRVLKSSIQKLCGLQNKIRLNFGAAVAFFKYLNLIEEKGGYLYPNEAASELCGSEDFNKALCKICLVQILKDGFLDTEAIHYNRERRAYVIERYGFSVSAALFRNILIQFKVLKESGGELVLNSEYESVFAEYKRKQGAKKSLEQLKKQLEQQELQGEEAEQFVVEYEKHRLLQSTKKDSVKRISVIDVSAGYDILSYEDGDSAEYDRFIEVKSFSGNAHFYWSENEIETAKLYEDRYYIYLIDASMVKRQGYEPTIIKNPATTILASESWIMSPTSYLVTPTE